MKKILVVFLMFVSLAVHAQESTDEYTMKDEFSKFSMGFGLGQDFGGIGSRLTLSPAKGFGLFAGLGYNLVGFGFNGGAIVRFAPAKRVNPTVVAMYGYNGVIKVVGKEEYDKSYNGFTLGGGVQLNSKKNPNYWSFELLIPSARKNFTMISTS